MVGVLEGFLLCYIALLLYIYINVKLSLGMCRCKNKMNGKTVIITGASSGLGREITLDLARRGARIIMACRNVEAAAKVRDEIAKETKNDDVIVTKLDLTSFKSIRAFASHINETEPRLDVLIHNAGIIKPFKRETTCEGLEMTMATNQYGPFLLTHLLIDLLKKTGKSRIVVVASVAYRLAKVNLKNPNPIKQLPWYTYYVSKYANIMFTFELARRLEGTGVTANCLHPGTFDSGIWRYVPFPLNVPLMLYIRGILRTTQEAAQSAIHLAVSDEVEGVSGKYFAECKEYELYPAIKDVEAGRKFWDICRGLVHLSSSDPMI